MATSEPDPADSGRGALPGPRVGILGGTFDPVHFGHLRIAIEAREALGLDHVRLIPLAEPVHRPQPTASAQQRLAMLHAATAGHAELRVDAREIRRSGPSYMLHTLRSLRSELVHADLWLLLGSDAFAAFHRWHDPDAILAIANLAVLKRPGEDIPTPPELQRLIAGRRVSRLRAGGTGQVIEQAVTQLDIASSAVRDLLAQGRSADFLLPAEVLDLIRQHALYR